MRKPARTIDWSSATRTRIVMAGSAQREPGGEHEAALGGAAGGHLAAVDLDPLAHAHEPAAAAVTAGRPAVVAHLDAQVVAP